MKTYKEFKNISENFGGEYTPSGGRKSTDARDSIVSLNDLGDPEAMSAVNAFIKQHTSTECMNPRQRVAQLRTRLNTVGLHFDFNPASDYTEGTEDYALTQFGGRYGWDMEKGDVVEDDGITPKLGYGLALRINYTKAESGLYRIEANIVKKEESE